MPGVKRLLVAVVGETDSVSLSHWMRALQIAEEWRASLHRIYEQITNQSGYSAEAELERRIMEVVRNKRNSTTGQISTYIKNYSTIQVGRAADGLAEVGLLQVSSKTWGNRLIKRYSLPDEEEME